MHPNISKSLLILSFCFSLSSLYCSHRPLPLLHSTSDLSFSIVAPLHAPTARLPIDTSYSVLPKTISMLLPLPPKSFVMPSPLNRNLLYICLCLLTCFLITYPRKILVPFLKSFRKGISFNFSLFCI